MNRRHVSNRSVCQLNTRLSTGIVSPVFLFIVIRSIVRNCKTFQSLSPRALRSSTLCSRWSVLSELPRDGQQNESLNDLVSVTVNGCWEGLRTAHELFTSTGRGWNKWSGNLSPANRQPIIRNLVVPLSDQRESFQPLHSVWLSAEPFICVWFCSCCSFGAVQLCERLIGRCISARARR